MTLPRCLVTGVDASPESLAALELALELADRLEARLVVVHAVGLLEEGGYRPRPDLGAIVDDARQRVGAGGAVVDTVYEDGPPPDVLLRIAEQRGRRHARRRQPGCERRAPPAGFDQRGRDHRLPDPGARRPVTLRPAPRPGRRPRRSPSTSRTTRSTAAPTAAATGVDSSSPKP